MTDRAHKKPGVAFWATVLVVVALVAYPLSFGPACWVTSRQDSPYPVLNGMYGPLCKSALAIGRPAWACLVAYGRLGMSPGTRVKLPTGPGEKPMDEAAIDK
jgi:hypothetical protein